MSTADDIADCRVELQYDLTVKRNGLWKQLTWPVEDISLSMAWLGISRNLMPQ